MGIKAIAVFCGSKEGNNPLYVSQTSELGAILAEKKITLIYGAGNKGIMGTIANAMLANGGKVVGIIPTILQQKEHLHMGITETHVVANMHIRKQMIYEKADAAIILPGGYGTLDELFEILTWNALEIHNKKIFFLNTNGFYDHLIAHINTMYTEGFLYNHPIEQFTVLQQPSDVRGYF